MGGQNDTWKKNWRMQEKKKKKETITNQKKRTRKSIFEAITACWIYSNHIITSLISKREFQIRWRYLRKSSYQLLALQPFRNIARKSNAAACEHRSLSLSLSLTLSASLTSNIVSHTALLLSQLFALSLSILSPP